MKPEQLVYHSLHILEFELNLLDCKAYNAKESVTRVWIQERHIHSGEGGLCEPNEAHDGGHRDGLDRLSVVSVSLLAATLQVVDGDDQQVAVLLVEEDLLLGEGHFEIEVEFVLQAGGPLFAHKELGVL